MKYFNGETEVLLNPNLNFARLSLVPAPLNIRKKPRRRPDVAKTVRLLEEAERSLKTCQNSDSQTPISETAIFSPTPEQLKAGSNIEEHLLPCHTPGIQTSSCKTSECKQILESPSFDSDAKICPGLISGSSCSKHHHLSQNSEGLDLKSEHVMSTMNSPTGFFGSRAPRRPPLSIQIPKTSFDVTVEPSQQLSSYIPGPQYKPIIIAGVSFNRTSVHSALDRKEDDEEGGLYLGDRLRWYKRFYNNRYLMRCLDEYEAVEFSEKLYAELLEETRYPVDPGAAARLRDPQVAMQFWNDVRVKLRCEDEGY